MTSIKLQQSLIMKQSPILYLTPRIAIANLSLTSQSAALLNSIQQVHLEYYCLFNLTNHPLLPNKQVLLKWRGILYSLSQLFKLACIIETYLRNNVANTAIICVSGKDMMNFGVMVVKKYLDMCCAGVGEEGNLMKLQFNKTIERLGLTIQHPYFSLQIDRLYQRKRLGNPPVKIIESLSLSSEQFIPIFEIFTQTRYNDFQSVYKHKIEEQLTNYYLQLDSPLLIGHGQKYSTQKPQTKYLQFPAVVCGDVKIVVYSYCNLAMVQQFSIGFNTLGLEGKQLVLHCKDLYEAKVNVSVKIQYDSYCSKKGCETVSKCSECEQISKKLGNRYTQCESDLQKFCRRRTKDEVKQMLSL